MRLDNLRCDHKTLSLHFLGRRAGFCGQEISQQLMTSQSSYCRVCGGTELGLVKPSNLGSPLTSDSFAITDSHYGVTAAIYRCANCEFLQCSDLEQVLPFYESLEDSGYEVGRRERGLQARGILRVAQRLQPGGRLLDIGAGSGILIEQATQMGYVAEGVEPSAWLHRTARQRELPVHLGIFPHPAAVGKFDLITLIDVLEHVSDPLDLLRNIAKQLTESGVALVVTPDVGSFAARVLGWRWWHFRVAHIGYFNQRNLILALNLAGLEPVFICRPSWFFTADYLWTRVHRYLPGFLRFAPPHFLSNLVLPINLRDSWLIACRRKIPCP